MITDGVIGETHQARQIIQKLHERSASCSFIRVGPYDPGNKSDKSTHTSAAYLINRVLTCKR